MKKYCLFLLMAMGSMACSVQEKGEAHWISDGNKAEPNTWLAYRKDLKVKNIPSVLNAKIAADTKYWLWINGKMVVFEGGLKRGPSPTSSYYDEIDIAPYLQKGDNRIALLLWHFGKEGFSHKNSGVAALYFDAESPKLNIQSDSTWECIKHPAYGDTEKPFPNFRLAESNIRFDANKDIEGWFKSESKTVMKPACMIDAEAGKAMGELVKRPIPMWKDSGLREYANVRTSGDTLICKLPYNAQVTPYIKVDASRTDTIHILTDHYRGGGPENIRAEYITRKGVQEYENLGWINGHEVYYIIPEGVEVKEVKYRETGYDTDFTASFKCDDPFMNELWKRSARTLYITMRDNYMDCPDRERAQWWGDEVNELGETFYALSPSAQKLAVKGIYELMNWQRENGTIFAPIPAGNWNKELPLQMLASVSWYGFYTQYFYSGDNSFVAPIYDRLHRYLHDVWKTDENGMAIMRDGEWTWGDWGENIDMDVLTSCWYYLALKGEKEFAKMLQKNEDVDTISKMMERIEKNFDSYFWTGSAYRAKEYKGKTDDRSQAMAILSGLASADKYPKLFKVLQKEYHASPYMEKYVLEALFQIGEPEYALTRIKNRYHKMMNYDYTTLFEGWGIGNQGFGGGTINHAWSGGPLTLLSQKVCGIEPTEPGFKVFEVTPQMGSLNEASATVHTHYGMISVSLKKKDAHHADLTVEVPEGTEAVVPVSESMTKTLKAGKHSLTVFME